MDWNKLGIAIVQRVSVAVLNLCLFLVCWGVTFKYVGLDSLANRALDAVIVSWQSSAVSIEASAKRIDLAANEIRSMRAKLDELDARHTKLTNRVQTLENEAIK